MALVMWSIMSCGHLHHRLAILMLTLTVAQVIFWASSPHRTFFNVPHTAL